MRRKVIQIANSTQLVSLPRKWAQSHHIKKGDEVEVVEQGNSVIITVDKTKALPKSGTIDITGLGNVAKRVIGSLYAAGYDDLIVTFSDYSELEHVQTVIRNGCIGYEIIEQGKKQVHIRRVSEAITEDFDHILRRMIAYISTMSQELYEGITTKNKEQIHYAMSMDSGVNKFADFCLRTAFSSTDKTIIAKIPIIHQLERLGDCYRSIGVHSIKQGLALSKKTTALLEELNKNISTVYEMLFKFKLTSLSAHSADQSKKYKDQIYSLMRSSTKEEIVILCIFEQVTELLKDLHAASLVIAAITNKIH